MDQSTKEAINLYLKGVNYAITYLVYAARETVRQDKWGLRLSDDASITILSGIAKKSMQYMVNQFFSA